MLEKIQTRVRPKAVALLNSRKRTRTKVKFWAPQTYQRRGGERSFNSKVTRESASWVRERHNASVCIQDNLSQQFSTNHCESCVSCVRHNLPSEVNAVDPVCGCALVNLPPNQARYEAENLSDQLAVVFQE